MNQDIIKRNTYNSEEVCKRCGLNIELCTCEMLEKEVQKLKIEKMDGWGNDSITKVITLPTITVKDVIKNGV